MKKGEQIMSRNEEYKYQSHSIQTHPHKYLKERQNELLNIYQRNKWNDAKNFYDCFFQLIEPTMLDALEASTDIIFIIKEGKLRTTLNTTKMKKAIEKKLKRLDIFYFNFNHRFVLSTIESLTIEWEEYIKGLYEADTDSIFDLQILLLIYGVWLLDCGQTDKNIFTKMEKLAKDKHEYDVNVKLNLLLSVLKGLPQSKEVAAFLDNLFKLTTVISLVNQPYRYSVSESMYEKVNKLELEQFLTYVEACIKEQTIEPQSYQKNVDAKNEQLKRIIFGNREQKRA